MMRRIFILLVTKIVQLLQFDRNLTTNEFTYNSFVTNAVDGVTGLRGVYYIGMLPNDKKLFALGKLDNSVVVFNRDINDGHLEFERVLKRDNGINGLFRPTHITFSSDNTQAFMTTAEGVVVLRDSYLKFQGYPLLYSIEELTKGQSNTAYIMDGKGSILEDILFSIEYDQINEKLVAIN